MDWTEEEEEEEESLEKVPPLPFRSYLEAARPRVWQLAVPAGPPSPPLIYPLDLFPKPATIILMTCSVYILQAILLRQRRPLGTASSENFPPGKKELNHCLPPPPPLLLLRANYCVGHKGA